MTARLIELIELLPEALRERTRIVREAPLRAGRYVLYWMHNAVRTDENPALDAAIRIANARRLGLLVYHGLSQRHPYASDRLHTFLLQGARDVQKAFLKRGIPYAFHLEQPGKEGPYLKALAHRAALVITEEMPVQPLVGWTRSLAQSTPTPILGVDTACVVPMQKIDRPYERAFEFRAATRTLYTQRLQHKLPQVELSWAGNLPHDLPFEPVDLQDADIAEMVAMCEIDHSIGPVPHTVGGSIAGYERWQQFKDRHLSNYARTRNDPLADGVSRLSAYLHYGMISPLRIAREAAADGSEGANKFLDELLVWRELAYAFCFYRAEHEQLTALPDWAQATLAEHATDPRPALPSWETLARGGTGDVLWDTAQQSLLRHGELHNNVRMTWGKAILQWTRDPQSALEMLIDLNHRYALDGRDPASYGGILWCLGQFDRPFPPARPILGTVRERSTQQHLRRLDIEAYRHRITRPLAASLPRVAIIGAGLSGLICARTLHDHGIPVTVWEKSRGVGGRMATRRGEDSLTFDHGAQYFTVLDERFRRYVKSWQHDGLVEPWHGRVVVLREGTSLADKSTPGRYVATPTMNSVCKHLARELDVRLNSRVATITKASDTATTGPWHLISDTGQSLDMFDVVITSAPARQSAELLRCAPQLADRIQTVAMQPCWAALVAWDRPWDLDFAAAFVEASPLAWIARNSSKPGRSQEPDSWVLHATPSWSSAHLESTADSVRDALLDAFCQATGVSPRPARQVSVHRWRYALAPHPLGASCLFDSQLHLGACGDWCVGPRVEGAFLSGMAAAGRILGLLTDAPPYRPPETRLLFDID